MISRTVLTAGVLSCLAILLFVTLGLPPGHSAMFNLAWATHYSEALSWTDPLPRYLPGLWSGFGGHDFFFYAPLPFWVIAAVADPLCWGCRPSTELVLGSSIFLVASGVSMFAFLRRFFDSRPAAFGAAFYVLMPYHLLLDWFLRQAAGEFAAYAFIPLVALGIDQIRKGERGTVALTLGVAGTALSHLPTTLLAAHVFGLLVLVLVARADGGWIGKLRLLAGFAWPAMLGLALASFYWLPAVVLLDTVSPHVLFDPYFEAWRWLYADGAETPNEHFALTVSIALLACAPLVLGSFLFARGPLLVWILVPTTLALFLNTAPSEPIWRNWIISKVQFPWRMMIFVDFAAGISAAVLLNSAASRVGRYVLSAALIAAVLPTAYLTKQVKLSMDQALPETQYHDGFAAIEYLSPEMNEALGRRLDLPELDHFDQEAVARSIADMATQFAHAHPDVNILRTGTRSLTAVGPRDADVMPLPVQYWSLWTALNSSGTALETRPNPVFGTLDIIAPAGGFDREPVHVSLRYRPSEVIGAVVAVLAMLVLLATSIRARRRKH